MIDWKLAQQRLGCIIIDGIPGRETYGLLLARAVGRKVDANMEKMAQALAKYAHQYGVDQSAARLANFIAQMAHECGGFRRFEENLNYSAQGLANTWPTRYAVNPKAKTKAANSRAMALARRPEAIANDTYGLRMGNLPSALDTDSNPDGWQYRGRGPGMLTGRANYEIFGAAVGLDLIRFPDLASDPGVGVLLFLEFCKRARVFQAVDAGDKEEARRRVNGGVLGLREITLVENALLGVLQNVR